LLVVGCWFVQVPSLTLSFVTLAWEGILTGSLEGVREGARTRSICFLVFGCVSGGCAQVIRLEVLFSMGSRRERGICPIRECAVPARLRLSACATSVPVHRASSIAVPDFAHFFERLGSMRRDHSLTHQRTLGIFDLQIFL
jgi:hypothetical protein